MKRLLVSLAALALTTVPFWAPTQTPAQAAPAPAPTPVEPAPASQEVVEEAPPAAPAAAESYSVGLFAFLKLR